MFRLWVKVWKDNRLIKDTVVENDERDTRTHKVLQGLEEGGRRFDLAVPIWLDNSIRDFQRHASCRFTKDAVIEEIDFDYLEIRVIEEDMYY